MLDLNMSHGKISDFASFPLFRFDFDKKISILKVIEILYYFLTKK